jgi:hypothetical protein
MITTLPRDFPPMPIRIDDDEASPAWDHEPGFVDESQLVSLIGQCVGTRQSSAFGALALSTANDDVFGWLGSLPQDV